MFKFKLLNYLLEIVKLYLYLFILIFLLYKLMSLNIILNYILLIIFMISLFYEERIKGFRYIFFLLFVLFHFIILKEGWFETEVLIIQDLFWYSLVMLTSFVWHVLILNWMYKLCEKLKWDYGCYVVSRWSLLTSLTIILWLVLWLEKIFLDFKIYQFGIKDNRICDKGDIIYLIKALFVLLKWIIEYFGMSFQNYSKLLLGVSIKINILGMPIKFYIYFISLLLISLLLMIPRIYIVWVLIVIWKVSVLIKDIWIDWKECKIYYLKGECTLFSFFSERIWMNFYNDRWDKRYFDDEVRLSDYKFRNLWTDDWKLIYTEGLIKEFIFYTKLPSWEREPRHLVTWIENLNDIFKIFEYSPNRYKNLLIRMLESLYYDEEDSLYYFNKYVLEEEDYLEEEDWLGNYKIDGVIIKSNNSVNQQKESSIKLWKASKFIKISLDDLRSGKISVMNIIKQDKIMIFRG